MNFTLTLLLSASLLALPQVLATPITRIPCTMPPTFNLPSLHRNIRERLQSVQMSLEPLWNNVLAQRRSHLPPHINTRPVCNLSPRLNSTRSSSSYSAAWFRLSRMIVCLREVRPDRAHRDVLVTLRIFTRAAICVQGAIEKASQRRREAPLKPTRSQVIVREEPNRYLKNFLILRDVRHIVNDLLRHQR